MDHLGPGIGLLEIVGNRDSGALRAGVLQKFVVA
jgi:hypothetical protein